VFDRALRPYYLARTKAKAAPDLPPIVYAGTPAIAGGMNCVWVKMDTQQEKAYKDMARMATARVSGGICLANGVLAEITRLRQLANAYGKMTGPSTMVPIAPSGKIDWIMQFLLERQEGNGKFIIASSFTEMVELVAMTIKASKQMDYEVMTLTGNTTPKGRVTLQERFQDPDDGLRVIVLNSKAGGEAITLDRADDLIAVDLPWTSDEFVQLENRAHRVSRIHNVTVHRLASEGTIDQWLATLTDDQRAALLAARPERQAEMFKEAGK
jgi:SNF2 family DNA or RNA helicase